MDKRKLIIAIDGPAGSGKTTVAKNVAEILDYLHIDSGSMYRALTLKVLKQKINLDNKGELIKLAKATKIDLEQIEGKFTVLLDGEDVSDKLRTPEINKNINTIAAVPEIRKHLLEIQRTLGKNGGIVMEGRDIGTVVFPHADRKFYLDASIKERIRRRFEELSDNGREINLSKLEESIRTRDKKDKTRDANPLKIAEDAIVIDTTGLSIEEVTQRILRDIKK